MDENSQDAISKLIRQARANLGQPWTNCQPSTPAPAKQFRHPLEAGAEEPLCPTCHTPAASGYFRSDALPGDPQFGKLVKCGDPFHSEVRAERMAAVSNLGQEDIKRRLADIKPVLGNQAMLEAAANILERGYGWLYIFGGPGNAKSEVLKAIVNQCNEDGHGPAVYTTLGTILDYIRQGYVANDYLERYQRLIQAPVLAVDEMDKIKQTEWVEEFRFKFLDARYMSAVNKETMTIFAGQPHPKAIFEDVIYDRFRDGRFYIVENKAHSARPQMCWDEAA